MFTTVAWAENIDPGAADVELAAVEDNSVFTENDLVRVPQGMANLIAARAVIEATTPVSARIESPTLRQLTNQYIHPIDDAVGTDAELGLAYFPQTPRPLSVGEGVEAIINATGGVAADNWVVGWFADGAQQAVQGNIFTTRATTSIAAANLTWASGQLTFDERLPIANYRVVGMTVVATDLIAARLIFRGSPWRPGVPGVSSVVAVTNNWFRYGMLGVWGEFDLNQPPSLEIIGGGSTSQTVLLDLIRQ